MYENKSAENLSGKNDLHDLKKEIKKCIKEAVKVSDKVAEIKPEVDRFIGMYYLLKNNPRKGLKYFQKSIEFALHLGALPELGRSYFEMGKFLAQSNSKYKNTSADYYLSEAKKIFEQLNLKWDIEKMGKII
jgi:hypothetical protein